jgi:copper(I)-binding protein
MLTGLEHALDVDDRVEVTLVFELAGEIVIEAEVRAP